MAGMMLFTSLADAVRNGFEACGRTEDGYVVRMRTARGWAMALVVLRRA